jgi:secreted PhoX family phosphatase
VTTDQTETHLAAGPVAPAAGTTFAEIVQQRLSRRGLLKAGIVVSAVAAAAPALSLAPARPVRAQGRGASRLSFTPIQPSTADQIVVANGYRSQLLISWGDPLVPGLPPFDVATQTPALQAQRFGFNCDFVAYLALPQPSGNPNQGLLWVNHEYTDGLMMFPGYSASSPTQTQVDVELAAHGASIVEVQRQGNSGWSYDPASRYNRRITATTPIRISGPAAGHDWLKTAADPTGTTVLGMLNNCGGGVTPWGTVLTAEENFNQYFANVNILPESDTRKAVHRRYGLPGGASERKWERYHERFDTSKHPNEPFRFGWVVEVDPYDPTFQPVKRTALGRLKHEAATSVVAPSGQVGAYTGDDERFEHVYKFVSQGRFDPNDRAANLNLLDQGTLYAARFNADGTGTWVPLVFGQGALTAANGFTSQADVLIRARNAALAAGATRMDRPEDVETNPATGKVYMVMTNNTNRGVGTNPGADPPNPRASNRWGHIIEVTEAGNDPAGTAFRWEIFLLCGDPADPSTYFAGFDKSQVSKIANPDNITFDTRGNLWIATDGQPGSLGVNDAIHGVPTEGPERGHVQQLLSAVSDSEVASLELNPNDQALFASIQHPGEGGSLAAPRSTWPNTPARPSVVVVTRDPTGPIGG